MSHFCQSCSMPLDNQPQLYGSEADGSPNLDYCTYCYQNGAFTADISMEEMIAFCIPHMIQAHPEMTEERAREILSSCMPTLKRWSSMSREKIELLAEELLARCFTVTLCSITENGFPRPCVLVRVAQEGMRKIYVATGSSSHKTAQFRSNPKAGLSFSDDKDGVTLLGTVRILDEPDQRSKYWQEWMNAHFPLGKNDPEFTVLEFSTLEATYWIQNHFASYNY